MATEFSRGQKSPLSNLTQGTDLYVGVKIEGPGTWDISCFGLDEADTGVKREAPEVVPRVQHPVWVVPF